jgi:group I intron endonuclease
VNKENGNTYIGSSVNLGRRFRVYYDFSYLSVRINKSKSRIYSSILKHGYSNFQFPGGRRRATLGCPRGLEILEYCTKENAINREQYYIDLLKPEYNLNSIAGSRLGSIHSEETRLKMSTSAQGRNHTEETKKLISLATKGINNPNFGKTHSEETKALISLARLGKSLLSESMKAKMSEESGTALRVIDLKTNEISVYTSITKAAKAMCVTQPPLSSPWRGTFPRGSCKGRRVKNTQGSFIVKKRYQVEKVNDSIAEGSEK